MDTVTLQQTQVPPYGAVTEDGELRAGGRRFRLLVSGWRLYKGERRADMNGLAILDEDNGVVLTDCLCAGNLENARLLFRRTQKEGLLFLVALVNGSPRARFHLDLAGELRESPRVLALAGFTSAECSAVPLQTAGCC